MRTPLPERVEGTTQFRTLHHPWFRCRMQLNNAPDSDDTQGGRRRSPQTAQMMCGMRDQDGNTLDLKASDRLEVNSRELGRAIYEVVSEPEPIRKKRRMLGHIQNLTRVEENEFERAEP